MSGVILHHSLPHFIETGFLTEPGPSLVAIKPPKSFDSPNPQHTVLR